MRGCRCSRSRGAFLLGQLLVRVGSALIHLRETLVGCVGLEGAVRLATHDTGERDKRDEREDRDRAHVVGDLVDEEAAAAGAAGARSGDSPTTTDRTALITVRPRIADTIWRGREFKRG